MYDEFIGTRKLIEVHSRQIKEFEKWYNCRDWTAFHQNHYDWWAFPIQNRSNYGDIYKVPDDAVWEMKACKDFMCRHRRGFELVSLAWGWDLNNSDFVQHPDETQRWSNWPVRLNKMARSARVFGHEDIFMSLRSFAKILYEQDNDFSYNGRNQYSIFQ